MAAGADAGAPNMLELCCCGVAPKGVALGAGAPKGAALGAGAPKGAALGAAPPNTLVVGAG